MKVQRTVKPIEVYFQGHFGELLGYIVSPGGIKDDPSKFKAITKTSPPKTEK